MNNYYATKTRRHEDKKGIEISLMKSTVWNIFMGDVNLQSIKGLHSRRALFGNKHRSATPLCVALICNP